jgi:HK97 family phage prohead protease
MARGEKMDFVKRNYPAEFRADEQTGLIEGIPIVFDTPTDIGGWFQETICAGAISEDIIKDVRFFWNHNIDEKAIARTVIPLDKPGGMTLTIEDKQVKMLANPNRKRTDANDLCIAIEDGVINAMSFMFGVAEERWEDEDTDYPKRFITRIDPLIEVSAVNFPAYATTDIHARGDTATEIDRAALDKMRERRKSAMDNSKTSKPKNILYYYYGGK